MTSEGCKAELTAETTASPPDRTLLFLRLLRPRFREGRLQSFEPERVPGSISLLTCLAVTSRT